MTNPKNNNKPIRTLKDLHNSLPNPNYVTMNPKEGIASVKQPNFVTKRTKSKKDNHELLEIHYTEW